MATTAGSTLKTNVFNEANEALYDPYSGLNDSLNESLIDIPWSEWNDADLNHEIWEDKLKLSPNSLFEDSNPPTLPIMIRDNVCSWKRPFELFPEDSLTVYDPNNSEFALSLPSSNAECELFQCFNERLTILQIYAFKYDFPVESETSTFVPNTQGEVWRPWHHIYSCCKAGKGQIHRPLYNPFGKYVIRLFYMSTWRKFVVDDRIPCDCAGRCMLPVTQSPGELWPILLAKGFLKIASLTPGFSLLDFPLLTFFTGWISHTIITGNKTHDQIWRRLLCLTPHHEQLDEEMEVKTVPASVKGSSKIASSKDHEKSEPQTKHFCFLLATLEGFPENPNLLYSHQIGIIVSKDLSLGKSDKREAIKAWKRIRWVYWASAKGICTDEDQLIPYRLARYITCIRELNSLLAPESKHDAVFEISDVGNTDSQFQGDVSVYRLEDWLDFNKLQKYLFSLDVLFKPSCLPFSFKVTCLSSNALNKIPESSGGGKTASKTAPPPSPLQTVFFQPVSMLPNQNEPCLLFCESTTNICLIMSLWVHPQTKSKLFGYLDSEQPVIFKVGQASLVIERSDWRMIEQGEILGVVKSVGNSSIWLNLSPGRHILKLWLKAKSPYVLNIYSNTEVIVSKSSRTRFLMSAESERVLQYIGNVSNAFIALTKKFGKPDLRSSLADFYEAIKPKNDKDVDYRMKMDDFIESFLLCILLSCKNLTSNSDEVRIMMDALRSLFINPKICCDLPRGERSVSLYGDSAKKSHKKVVVVLKERTLSQILSYPWLPDEIEKVILIQRVFRGYRVRLLWKYQTPARKEFKFFTDKLKKICDIIFSPGKRELEVGKIIRQVAMMNPQLITTFRFHEDFSKVIQVEEITGKVANVEPFAWIPFARFIVACHSPEPVPYAMYVSSNLEQFVVQAIDNDTGEELFRVSNSVMPHYYQSNMTGYTVLIYGWNEANVKTVNWRLQMVKMKHFQLIHMCNTMLGSPCHPYSIPSLDVLEIKNFYVPNLRMRVCRCLIKVQKRTLLTVRLSTSYSRAQFYVKIYSSPKFNFSESETPIPSVTIATANSSNGSVLIPSIVLDHVEVNNAWGESNFEEESTTYVLEAFVMRNTWPLTKHEWGVVEPFRVNGESWKDSLISLTSKRGTSESKRKLTRMSKRSLNEQRVVENPFWSLQVLSDSTESPDPGDHVVVEEDKTYADAIKAMKVSWEERNPGRRKRGRELRYNFLYECYQEEMKSLEKRQGEKEGRKDEPDRECVSASEENFKVLLERLSNFCYLTNEKSPLRCWKSPRILPNVPMYELLRRYARSAAVEENEYYKSNLTSVNLAEEPEEQPPSATSPRLFVNELNYYRNVIMDYLAEEQKLSVRLMGESYERRSKAVERLAR